MEFHINPLLYNHILGFTENVYPADAIELIRNATFYSPIALPISTIRRIVETILIEPDQPTTASGHIIIKI